MTDERARRIDALVAEHVFGAEWHDAADDGWRVLRHYDPSHTAYSIVAMRDPDGELSRPTTRYSTTWEGMGLVVEKHLADGGFVDMESDGPRIEWTVVFQDSAGRPFGRATAATAPLACALAALRAKGVDVGQEP